MTLKTSSLVDLGQELKRRGYCFTAVTPNTHQRVYCRPHADESLTSVFGWNRPFKRVAIDQHLWSLLAAAEVIEEDPNGLFRSRVRFATIGDLIFVHSSYPTEHVDAVFFGPDTYRFVRAIRSSLTAEPFPARSLRIVDIGTGSGAGGIFAASLLSRSAEVVLADINPTALDLAATNARLNLCSTARTILSDVFANIDGDVDLVIANPPYLIDAAERSYRHGGGELGTSLSLRVAQESLGRLGPGGRLLLYTGAPIVAGEDALFGSLRPMLQLCGHRYSYEEVDPDVFGEELDSTPYADVERIAAVVLNVFKE